MPPRSKNKKTVPTKAKPKPKKKKPKGTPPKFVIATSIPVPPIPGHTGTGTVDPCPICDVCQGSLNRNGFVFCIDGNAVLLNNYPETGGPWSPAIHPNGQVVWVNHGGD